MDLWNNRTWTPMLLDEIDEPFNSKDYLFEIKFDGIRAVIYVSPDEFEIRNRHNVNMTHLYPELKTMQKLVNKKTILDGEIVSMQNGQPSFSNLQHRSHLKDKNKIKVASINNPVVFVGFDILYENENLIDKKLIERKNILDKLKENDVFIKSKVVNDKGINLFKKIQELNLEGIVAKEKNSKYEINKRVKTWIKIKNFMHGEFIIGGYQEKKNNRISLALGEMREDKLYYVGSVAMMKSNPLYEKIVKSTKKNKSPFENYSNSNLTFITPAVKCEVTYLERTPNNHLRQPVLKK